MAAQIWMLEMLSITKQRGNLRTQFAKKNQGNLHHSNQAIPHQRGAKNSNAASEALRAARNVSGASGEKCRF